MWVKQQHDDLMVRFERAAIMEAEAKASQNQIRSQFEDESQVQLRISLFTSCCCPSSPYPIQHRSQAFGCLWFGKVLFTGTHFVLVAMNVLFRDSSSWCVTVVH